MFPVVTSSLLRISCVPKVAGAMDSSNENLLDRSVLYAFEKDHGRSIHSFQREPVGHSECYTLAPKPAYRRRSSYACCTVRTVVCTLLLILILGGAIGLGVCYFLGVGSFGRDDGGESPAGSNATDSTGADVARPWNSTEDPSMFVAAVIHPGAKILIRPPETGRVVAPSPSLPITVLAAPDNGPSTNNCTTTPSQCHRSATCQEGVCRCGPGLTGDGVTSCVAAAVPVLPVLPVLFSDLQICHPNQKRPCCCNAHCVHNVTAGYAACQCKKGYERKGARCVDVDECRSKDLNTCPEGTSDCFNVGGGHRCICRERGAIYDGTVCSLERTAILRGRRQ
ncbi:hypothetical protein BV898_13116 [Hypsibius exemplaris]|uniref:EGF-like calcium-binding domain-containing protein n=1 Tax=Hypsibius exemplaris TaxID=2072580 RepID=A0A1W0WBN2_HYPEX|nr:hypothetical protein BV898_13116 [Hypsibius exemplaris]